MVIRGGGFGLERAQILFLQVLLLVDEDSRFLLALRITATKGRTDETPESSIKSNMSVFTGRAQTGVFI